MLSRWLKRELAQWGPIDGKILYPSFWFAPIARLVKQRWQVAWAEWIGVFESRHRMTFYYDTQRMSAKGAKAIETWVRPSVRRKRLWRAYEKIQKSLRQAARQIKELIDSNEPPTREALRKSGSLWFDCMMDMWSIGVVPEVANYGATAYLWSKIKSCIPEKYKNEVLEVLLAPRWLSFHQQSEKELLRMASETSSRRELEKRMEAYTKKWYWINNSYYESLNLSTDDFLKTLKRFSRKKILQKYAAIKNYPETIKFRKKEVAKRWNLSPKLLQLTDALSFSIWWQDHRKGLSWWAHGIVDMLSLAAAERFNTELNEIMMYTAREWRKLLTSGTLVPPSVIKRRKKLTVFDFLGDKVIEYSGRKAKFIVDSIRCKIQKPETKKRGNIAGIGVSRGVTRGIVYILLSPRELSHMKKGRILVSPMTSPDYIVAMRKAKGVVTDTGGLTCHAAIISRELGIPCVVGTKIATKVLNDGDLIEINAKEGIVKILEKSNEIY